MKVKLIKEDECNSCNINEYKEKNNPACVLCEKRLINHKRKHISICNKNRPSDLNAYNYYYN